MSTNADEFVNLGVRVSTSWKAEIEKHVQETGSSISVVLRRALVDHMKREGFTMPHK